MSRLKVEMHPLLTEAVIKDLFSKNIYTILNFLESEVTQITSTTHLSYKDVLGIRKHLVNKNSAFVQNGLDYYTELIQKSAILPTGIQSVDILLHGGLMTGNVYEICGLPASGKTQFCLALTKNVVESLNQSVYYIDTKRDFSGRKILRLLDERTLSQAHMGDIMSKILVKQINTKYELLNSLYGIKSEMQNGLQLRLIIIDSVPPLFYQSMDYTRNYGVMNQFVNIMQFLAKEYYVVFVVTNAVTTWYEGDFSTEKPMTEKLGLGKYWFSVPNTRLMIKQTNSASEYKFTVAKSSKLSKGTNCTAHITNVGIF